MNVSELCRGFYVQNFGTKNLYFSISYKGKRDCVKLRAEESLTTNYLFNNLQIERFMTCCGYATVESWQLNPLIDSDNNYQGIEILIIAK